MMALKQTALIEKHKALGGRLIDFGGWELPVQYSGVIDEHTACRTVAGLFDVSHMGEFTVEGSDAEQFLYHVVSNDISKMEVHQAQYSILCQPDGGAIDDLIVYRRAEDKFLVCVNASNTEKDFAWMKEVHESERFACKFENVSAQWSQIALQGPKAEAILQSLTRAKLSDLKSFRFIEDRVNAIPCIIARTGYTGEDGFEIYVAWNEGPKIWDAIMERGAPLGLKPCGLGARDTLRLEVKYPLYGQELTSATTPFDAGLGWAVKLDKSDFVGKAALTEKKAKGSSRKLVGIELKGAGIPRTGYKLFDRSGEKEVGIITSGTQSPSLKKSIGIAYIDAALTEVGTSLLVEIRSNKIPAEVVPTPFYKRPY